ncbi:MAG: hypothetical protein RBR68_14340, partial [Tenuifilaceae bacterium]|nr:hypothetical protein [Tenuifilaceae bacterium]
MTGFQAGPQHWLSLSGGWIGGGREYDDEFKTSVFLTANNLKPFISDKLIENSKPIIFSWNGKESIGYEANCNAHFFEKSFATGKGPFARLQRFEVAPARFWPV